MWTGEPNFRGSKRTFCTDKARCQTCMQQATANEIPRFSNLCYCSVGSPHLINGTLPTSQPVVLK